MLATCADLLFMSIMCIPSWLMQVELDENLGPVSSSQAVVVPLPHPPALRFFTSQEVTSIKSDLLHQRLEVVAW